MYVRFVGLIEVGVGQEEDGVCGASLFVERINAGVGEEEMCVRSGGLGSVGEHEGEGDRVSNGVCKPSLSIEEMNGGASGNRVCWAVGFGLGGVGVGKEGGGECGVVRVGEREGGRMDRSTSSDDYRDLCTAVLRARSAIFTIFIDSADGSSNFIIEES